MRLRLAVPSLLIAGLALASALRSSLQPQATPPSAGPASVSPSSPSPPPAPARKPILTLYTLPVCPWCGAQKRALADPSVKAILGQFELKTADLESSSEARTLGIHYAPALVLTGRQKSLEFRIGYQSPAQLLAWLKPAAQARRPSASSKIIEAGYDGPGGRRVMIEFPPAFWKENITSRGEGCCVERSAEFAARLQNVPALFAFPEWIKETEQPGGCYAELLSERIAAIAKARGMAEPDYVNIETKDFSLLKLILATGRMACVDYSGADGVHYDSRIAHCVCLAYCDDEYVAILDNNFPPDKLLWMPTAEFKKRWSGWIVALCAPRPPAPPVN